jgi:hypothetical protein
MAYTTIKKPSDYFNTKLYTQNASTNAITGVNFQPDFTWIKNRDSGTKDHRIFDSVRGANKPLKVNGTNAEATETDTLNSFDSDGFTLGADTQGYGVNDLSGNNTVSWNWLGANGTASNTDGSITSTVSANTTSGFSIVSYTGTGSVATIGHGLGTTPSMMILKSRDNGTLNWLVYHKSIGNTGALYLDLTNGTQTISAFWNNTSPTSSVFTIGTGGTPNNSGDNYIAYCFAEKKGFSKFGSYTGNGAVSGPFIYLGFKPAFFLLKETSGADNWTLIDSKRLGYNKRNEMLFPNLSNAEYPSDRIQLYSNGVKINNDDPSINQSGSTYIYMAFAEEPLVGDNPATAR